MTPIERCYQLLINLRHEVAATQPPGRVMALLALLRFGDVTAITGEPTPSARPGWKLALRLCLEPQVDQHGEMSGDQYMITAWAERFLVDCDQLALADEALSRCASGELQLQQRDARTFVAWPTSRRHSAEERERADFDWWSAHLTRQTTPRLSVLRAKRDQILALPGQEDAPHMEPFDGLVSGPTIDRYYHQLGQAHVARFAHQHSYPADAAIGGVTFGRYTDILALLIGWLYRERDLAIRDSDHTPMPRDEGSLVAALSAALDTEPATIERALLPLVLDRDNAAYHSAIPRRAAPPLIRLDDGRMVWSALGLLGEPLIFLTRELRRRYAQEYHNSAYLREGVFRQDLYRLFGDRRFVLSAGRVELKRSGEARTDLDALIFDRKTGTLGIFELKAQDPFARSVEERQRQRANFLHANRQVSAILGWVQRYGADDLLARFDERAAKRFRVQKVYLFVLGRYLAHFVGGPEPDRRAAWGSWPQVLQIAGDTPIHRDNRNPLGALFTRLHDTAPPRVPADLNDNVISIGNFRLRIFPSFADMRSEEDSPA